MMKKISFALIAMFAGAAMATNYTPPPAPSPAPSQSQTQTGTVTANPVSSSTSNSGGGDASSASNAAADSNSNSAATVGNVGGGNSTVGDTTSAAGGGSATVDASTYSATGPISNTLKGGDSKYISLGFPAPVWTSVPTPFGCIVSKSKAVSVGWNFASGAESTQGSDIVCTTIRMSELAHNACHFESAAMLNKIAFEEMYKGKSGDFFLAGGPRNLKPMECEELKRPALRMAAHISQPAAPILQLTTVNAGSPSAPAACTKTPRTYTPAKKKAAPICK